MDEINQIPSPRIALLVSGLCLGLAFPGAAAEKTIMLKDAPAAVQKTIVDQLKGGKLRTLSVEVESGKTEYEAELTLDGHATTIVMDPSGKVLESEAVVELIALPDGVRAGLTREAGKGVIARVEEVTRGGVVFYEALVKEALKKDREVLLTAEGKLVLPKE